MLTDVPGLYSAKKFRMLYAQTMPAPLRIAPPRHNMSRVGFRNSLAASLSLAAGVNLLFMVSCLKRKIFVYHSNKRTRE